MLTGARASSAIQSFSSSILAPHRISLSVFGDRLTLLPRISNSAFAFIIFTILFIIITRVQHLMSSLRNASDDDFARICVVSRLSCRFFVLFRERDSGRHMTLKAGERKKWRRRRETGISLHHIHQAQCRQTNTSALSVDDMRVFAFGREEKML